MDEAWTETLRHLDEGNFTALQAYLGGPEGFDRQVIQWFDAGRFDNEPEARDEVLSCALMLGRTELSQHLIEKGIDPYAGMKTWLAGPHYAVSGGKVDTVKMLLDKKVPVEIENKYGGTLLGQALWSAVNEPRPGHGEIIELLIGSGAKIEPGTFEWWEQQDVPSEELRSRVANALKNAGAE